LGDLGLHEADKEEGERDNVFQMHGLSRWVRWEMGEDGGEGGLSYMLKRCWPERNKK
jgi:hypothetical protein